MKWLVQIFLHRIHKHVGKEHHLHVFNDDLSLIGGIFEDFLKVEQLYLTVHDLRILDLLLDFIGYHIVSLREHFLSRNQILDAIDLDRIEVLFVGILTEGPLHHAFVQWAPHSGGRVLHKITLSEILKHTLTSYLVSCGRESIKQDSSEDVFGVLQNAELA